MAKKTQTEPLAEFQDTTLRAIAEKVGHKKKGVSVLLKDERTYIIQEGKIIDDFCHYGYEIMDGVGIGEIHKVKGKVGIIKDSMRKAFVLFNVHLAALDEAFHLSGIEIEDIDKLHSHDLTGNYFVTGFEIKGIEDNESIVLIGNKYVPSAGGRMELKTPRIVLDSLSSYTWWNELKAASDKARYEVARYKEGHCTIPEPEDEENPTQLKIQIDQPLENNESNITEEEFEGGKE